MAERLWLGNNGTYQVLASYVCLFQDKKVKLRKPNGSVIAVPLHLLCEDDIAFIATQSGRLKTESTFKDPSKDQQQQQKQPIGILSSSPGYSSSSEKTMSTDAVKKNSETNELSTGPTEVLRHALTSAVNQHVRQITADESRKMLPNRSLSSITEKFKRHTFVDTPIVDHPTSHLAFLPTKIIGRLFAVLDTKSRFQLSLVNRRFHPFIYKPDTWKSIWFAQEDIDDIFLFRLAVFLQRQDLRKAVERVVLDGTKVTCSSVLLVIKHLENVETLSIQSCWNIHSYQLAVDLTHLAKSSSIKNRLAQVIVGKVLHRGPVENWSPMEPPLDSKSFGQDIWLAHSALNRLTNRNVAFDVALCNTCHLGAAAHDFQCISCGILPLLKCVGCAPRCDRCGNRSCSLPTCINPSMKIELVKCGRCHLALALCNSKTNCQQKEACSTCQGRYHIRCRSSDGTFVSNQCLSCGTVACPFCELVVCEGKCRGQWCKRCASSIQFSHCKCIVIHSKQETSTKSISKKNICEKCQQICNCCLLQHFCDRCLRVHSEKCT